MQVEVEKLGELKRKMAITVPAEEVDEEMQERFKEVAKQARIKGFRPGKVPMKVVKDYYGESVKQEIMQSLVQSTYPMALHEQEMSPINTGDIEIIQEPNEQRDFQYQVTFELSPDINLPELSEMTFERLTPEITDDDVAYHLEQLQKQYANQFEVDRQAQKGDYVTINLQGKINGEPIEGTEYSEESFELGNNNLPEELEHAIISMQAGESKTVKVTKPEGMDLPESMDQALDFDVTVNQVQELQLPELNDEFAQNVENSNFETLDELKEDIRRILSEQLDESAQEKLKDDILEALQNSTEFALPQTFVDEEIQRLKQQESQQQGESEGLSGEELEEQAKQNVHKGLIFNAYLEQNNIQLDRERVDQYIESLASSFGLDTETIKNALQSRKEDMSRIENRVLHEQAMEDMLNKVQTTEKPISAIDFEKQIANQ